MTVTFRDAVPADAEALSSLGRRTFVATFGHLYAPEDLDNFLVSHDAERWEEQLRDPALATRLAEDQDHAVGYCKIGPPELPYASADAMDLRQLYLLESWKGGGHALVLLDWAIAEARRRGASALYLSVYTDNQRARRFYEKHGFTEVGPYKFMVGNHADDDIILKRDL